MCICASKVVKRSKMVDKQHNWQLSPWLSSLPGHTCVIDGAPWLSITVSWAYICHLWYAYMEQVFICFMRLCFIFCVGVWKISWTSWTCVVYSSSLCGQQNIIFGVKFCFVGSASIIFWAILSLIWGCSKGRLTLSTVFLQQHCFCFGKAANTCCHTSQEES